MKFKNWKTTLIFGIIGVLTILSVPGCSQNNGLKLGEDVPSEESVTRLAAVMDSPMEYNGKTIVIEGIVSSQCAALCDFMLQDGPHKSTIFPQGFQMPKLNKGLKLKILALVTSGESNIVFSALGIESVSS